MASKPKPWGTIIAVIAVLALAGGVFGYAYIADPRRTTSRGRPGQVEALGHEQGPVDRARGRRDQGVQGLSPRRGRPQRVAYDQTPAFGGPHDAAWADCTGVVYDQAVRTENMVHGLEHGAVWIAYNPDQVKDDALDKLKVKVEGIPYMMMSPFPGLDKPISLQSWGHQLKLEKADDERIDQFISSLLRNPNTYPEVGASCENTAFLSNPAPFVAEKPGADAVPMDGGKDDSVTEGQPQNRQHAARVGLRLDAAVAADDGPTPTTDRGVRPPVRGGPDPRHRRRGPRRAPAGRGGGPARETPRLVHVRRGPGLRLRGRRFLPGHVRAPPAGHPDGEHRQGPLDRPGRSASSRSTSPPPSSNRWGG